MYKYYYSKNDKYYCLTDKAKLYEITCKHNLEFILKLENIIEYLTIDLNTNDFINYEFNDLPNREKYSLTEMCQMMGPLLANYLPNSNPELITLESTIFLKFINDYLKIRKERYTNTNNYLNDALKRYITDLKKELDNLKTISKYNCQEVDLSYLLPNQPKNYLPDIEELTEKSYQFISLITTANLDPISIFNKELDSREEKLIINKLKDNISSETINQKINYQNLKIEQKKVTYLRDLSYLLGSPLLFSILKNDSDLKSFISLTLTALIILGYQKLDKDLQKDIAQAKNPTLTLHKNDF